MKFTPSRTLNEPSTFMGLGILDLAGVGYFLVFSHQLLSNWNLELMAFIATASLTVILIKVRLGGRRKQIRDYIQFISKRIRL